MRWKLKDLLAESVHPVPEKAVLVDFRHAKTTSGKKQKQTRKKKAATKSTKILHQNKNCKTENERCHIEMIHKGGRHTRLRLLLTTEKHVRPQTLCPDLWFLL